MKHIWYKFNTTQSDLLHLNGKLCYIIRKLTADECDEEDVGKMYKVRFNDFKTTIDAFEDELTLA